MTEMTQRERLMAATAGQMADRAGRPCRAVWRCYNMARTEGPKVQEHGGWYGVVRRPVVEIRE